MERQHGGRLHKQLGYTLKSANLRILTTGSRSSSPLTRYWVAPPTVGTERYFRTRLTVNREDNPNRMSLALRSVGKATFHNSLTPSLPLPSKKVALPEKVHESDHLWTGDPSARPV